MRCWLVLSATCVLGSCSASGEKLQTEYFPDMTASVPYDAYDVHPSTPNGQTLMLPPEGTVPIGYAPDTYAPGEPDAIRAGETLFNPFEPSPEFLDRGQKVFDTICYVCHGPGGEGDGPIIGRFPNPASLLSEHARSYPDGRIYHVITHGQGIMPSHAVQVRPEDRWKVILHVRRMQAASLQEGDSP